MVRNEPFVWYAVMSVYPYVDEILLWDTGSTDVHTLQDIRRLKCEDTHNKIQVRHVTIDVDETGWSEGKVAEYQAIGRGKHTKGVVRQEMINATKTEWFLIVDGDEVHYRSGIKRIAELIHKGRPKELICGAVPLTWHCDLDKTFRTTWSGRAFRTKRVRMNGKSPNELHVDRKTKKIIVKGSPGRAEWHVTPYAHFETMLKPWRRQVQSTQIVPLVGSLPEVMQAHPFVWQRFLHEHGRGDE
jgi:hypothetical protein